MTSSISLVSSLHLDCLLLSGDSLLVYVLEILKALSILFLVVFIILIDCLIAVLRSLDIVIKFLLG